MPYQGKHWVQILGAVEALVLVAVAFLGSSAIPSWAEYKLYQENGFRKVAEIVEKEEHSDGTLTVHAKRKGSDEIVVIPNVVRIEETTGGKEFVPEYRPKATPTPVYVLKKISDSGTPVSPAEEDAGSSREGFAAFLRNIPNMGIAILGVMVLVVLGFVIMKGWS
jgi:hypothetical protein